MSEKPFIDFRDVIAQHSIEELNALADAYFASISDPTFHLSKPFNIAEESMPALLKLSTIIEGMQLHEGISVLDLGCGACWTSRILTQMGCAVICSDVSPSALILGRQLYERFPVIGNRPAPQFRIFDGRTLPLAGGEVERVLLFDVFHHVPNKRRTLQEIHRVLTPTGLAAFAEPGPFHSASPGAQSEMSKYTVIESDIIIEDIWKDASEVGFDDIRFSIVAPIGALFSFDEFSRFIKGKDIGFENKVREYNQLQRVFFLSRGPFLKATDSRRPEGLSCELQCKSRTEGDQIHIELVATNTGRAVWISRPGNGQVSAGCHLLSPKGELLNLDFAREPLPRDISPGESASFSFDLKPPHPSVLEFDMVSDYVCWFENRGSRTFRISVSR